VSSESTSAAISAWAAALGAAHVLTGEEELSPYTRNVSGVDRTVAAVVRPSTTAEVQEVVRIANRCRTPLYPISKGNNWGYGSSLPVREGCTVVDLGRMNRIRNEFNVAEHYATIEPGVTQGQLHKALLESKLPLTFNATAAGEETSVLGNSLDRGFGYFALRPDDLSNFEVVLGNGEILRTGYGHYENARTAPLYKFGIGPGLDGLFFQSNFGIVTAAALHLHPLREVHGTLLIKLQRDEDFVEFVEILADLRRKGVIECVLHIGSRSRMRVTLSPLIYQFLLQEGEAPGAALRTKAEAMVADEKFAAWTGIGGLFGTSGEVAERLKEIRSRLGHMALVDYLTGTAGAGDEAQATVRQRAARQSAQALVDFSSGIPSSGALWSPLWAVGESPGDTLQLDETRLGLLFCCPALPLSGEAAVEIVQTAQEVFGRFGFEPFMTLNIVNTKAMLCVLNLVFERSDKEQTARAHQCVDTLFDVWAARGIYPYRLGVQSMEQFVRPDDPFWLVVRGLKSVLDPNGIIAPGRYNLV
jgi:4-cresol dehydrogenase (hydroxylating)